MNIDSAIGAPNDRVTHWGISRIVGYKRTERGKRTPIYERETAPRGDGVRINEWPLEDCTLETVREKWGTGEFRCHWFILDPENPDPKQRRVGAGNGLIFELDDVGEIEETPSAEPVNVTPPAFMQTGDPMVSALQFTDRLIQMSDRRADRELEAIRAREPAAQNGGNADILAHIARLEAKMEADARQRDLEDRHRAELATKDREIEELKRAKEKAEEEAAKGDDGPTFDPDVSMWDQIPAVVVNGVMSLAKSHPEVAMGFVEKGLEFWEKRKAAPPAPPAAVPPAMAAAPPVRPAPVVQVVPRGPFPRAVDDPLTPARTARAADPAPPAAPVVESSSGAVDERGG